MHCRLLAGIAAAAIGLTTILSGSAVSAEGERAWTSPETLTANPDTATVDAQAVAMGPGGKATAVWVEDRQAYAARRLVGGKWSAPRVVGRARDVMAATLADGTTVMALTTLKTVTMYRWGDAGIRRGRQFERTSVGGLNNMVTNARGDIMVTYNRTCQYFAAAQVSWRRCPYVANGYYLDIQAMDNRGTVYAIANKGYDHETLRIFRPGDGWSTHRFAGRRLMTVATNGRGDLAVIADTSTDGVDCVVSATYRPRGGSFEPWRELSRYQCENGLPGEAHEAAVTADGRVILAWDEGREWTNLGEPRSVHVADRSATGEWTPARLLLDAASIDSEGTPAVAAFAANPAGDVVLVAQGEVPDGPNATRRVVWAVARPAGGEYEKPVELPQGLFAAETAIDADGDAVAVAIDEFVNVALAYEAA